MSKHRPQAASIPVTQSDETALEAALSLVFHPQIAGAEHGCQGQGDQPGEQDDHGDGDTEFAKQTTDDATHDQKGQKDHRQRQGHGDHRETDFPAAHERCLIGLFTIFFVTGDVLQHDHRIVHHEAHRQGQGEERQRIQGVPQLIDDGEGAENGGGDCQRADQGRAAAAEEEPEHPGHQYGGEQQGDLDFLHRRTDIVCLVVHHGHVGTAGQTGAQQRQALLDGVGDSHGIRVGLAHHGENEGTLATDPTGDLVIVHPVADLGDIGQRHHRTVGESNGHTRKGFGVVELSMHVHRIIAHRTQHRALGQVDVMTGNGLGKGLQRYPVRLHGEGVGVNAHRIILLPEDLHLGDPGNTGNGGHHLVHRILVELVDGHIGRSQGDELDGRRRRIELLDEGQAGHARRQQVRGLGDRVFHILGGDIDVLAEVELQNDPRRALTVHRAHGGKARNGGKLLFQRCRHGAGHGLRACSRQTRRDQDRRKVHAGQQSHRHVREGKNAIEHQPEDQYDRHHRAANEQGGEIHGPFPDAPAGWTAGPPVPLNATRTPG